MKQELENLQQISVDDIKECLKKNIPNEYDKMIILSDTQIKRADYFYVKHKSVHLTRHGKIIKFPLYGNIKAIFSELEGGEQKHGEKAILKSEKILEILKSNYNVVPEDYVITSINQPFEFPVDFEVDKIIDIQRKYFIPDLTFQEQCNECNGHKYITCTEPDCQGKHIWVCAECNGNKTVICDSCGGSKKVDCPVCDGSNRVKCKKCGGDGRVNDGIIAKAANSKYAQEKKCGRCQGKGFVQCTNCSNGKIVCQTCNGQGKLTCSECNGNGKITCSVCYGDKERYGMVDCPQCKTQGAIAQIAFVETLVHNNEIEKLFLTGDQLTEINEEQILSKHPDKTAQTFITLVNINENVKETYDEYTKKYGIEILNELGYKKDSFPKITNEEMNYQIIPCVQVSYKHMLTNAIHEVSILNFYKSPEIILNSKAEEVKKDLGNVGKAAGGVFGKLFKTKSFKSKEDKKNEIILMIYLAKADGKIEEEEKAQISELIGNLDDFTASEKQNIFILMNSPTLPELTEKQTTFFSKDRANEVISNLEKLASADGELEGQEKEFIEKVKSMLKYK